jgi:hypothetical protein
LGCGNPFLHSLEVVLSSTLTEPEANLSLVVAVRIVPPKIYIYIYISAPSPEYIDVDQYSPPPMNLDFFSDLRPMTPIREPRSDFDYPGALNCDIMDRALKGIEEDHPMYPVDSGDEVLASDPYPVV